MFWASWFILKVRTVTLTSCPAQVTPVLISSNQPDVMHLCHIYLPSVCLLLYCSVQFFGVWFWNFFFFKLTFFTHSILCEFFLATSTQQLMVFSALEKYFFMETLWTCTHWCSVHYCSVKQFVFHYTVFMLPTAQFPTLISFPQKIKWLEFKPDCLQFSTKNKCMIHICDRGNKQNNKVLHFALFQKRL